MEQIIVMPKLGLTMEEGMITKWYKKEGDTLKKGELLFAVETEKVTNDVECEYTGTLERILASEGEEKKCGESVAVIKI